MPRFPKLDFEYFLYWNNFSLENRKEYDVSGTESTKFAIGMPIFLRKDKLPVNLRLNVFTEGFNLPLVSRETREDF